MKKILLVAAVALCVVGCCKKAEKSECANEACPQECVKKDCPKADTCAAKAACDTLCAKADSCCAAAPAEVVE